MTTPESASIPTPLFIFCGKGGVGKTTLSLAFALRHAIRERTVLLVTSHPLAELAVSISLAGLKEAHPQAASHLFIVHIDPREVLAGKVKEHIPSAMLANAVLSSRIYEGLIEVAPGLKELAFLTRLHQFAVEGFEQQGEAKLDLLVWDAPATGHFLQSLKVARDFDLYLSGPFSLAGKELVEYFSDPSNYTLLAVTTLEEMAVEETIDLWQHLVGELKTRPTGVICNMASPLLASPDSVLDDVVHKFAREARDSPDLQFILDRHAIERALYHKLRASIDAGFSIVERRPSARTDLDLLLDLSEQLAGLEGH